MASTIRSFKISIPIFLVADPHTTGTNVRARVPFLSGKKISGDEGVEEKSRGDDQHGKHGHLEGPHQNHLQDSHGIGSSAENCGIPRMLAFGKLLCVPE